jgi:rubredoxin
MIMPHYKYTGEECPTNHGLTNGAMFVDIPTMTACFSCSAKLAWIKQTQLHHGQLMNENMSVQPSNHSHSRFHHA